PLRAPHPPPDRPGADQRHAVAQRHHPAVRRAPVIAAPRSLPTTVHTAAPKGTPAAARRSDDVLSVDENNPQTRQLRKRRRYARSGLRDERQRDRSQALPAEFHQTDQPVAAEEAAR